MACYSYYIILTVHKNQLVNWRKECSFPTLHFGDTGVSITTRKCLDYSSSGHLSLGRSFSNTNTISPSFKSFTACVHLGLALSVGKYSSNHRDQSLEINACTFRHRFLGLNDCISTSSEVNCPPICQSRK